MNKRIAVVQAGFLTRPKQLEPLANELVERGVVDDVEISSSLASSLTNPAEFARLSDRKILVGHSAAAVALKEANRVEPTKQPTEVIALCPAEPTPIAKLAADALKIVSGDLKRTVSGDIDLVSAARFFASTTMEASRRPFRNSKLAFEIANFSTIDLLRAVSEANVISTIVTADGDEFFAGAYCCCDVSAQAPPIVELNGYHDMPVLEPKVMFDQLSRSGGLAAISEAA